MLTQQRLRHCVCLIVVPSVGECRALFDEVVHPRKIPGGGSPSIASSAHHYESAADHPINIASCLPQGRSVNEDGLLAVTHGPRKADDTRYTGNSRLASGQRRQHVLRQHVGQCSLKSTSSTQVITPVLKDQFASHIGVHGELKPGSLPFGDYLCLPPRDASLDVDCASEIDQKTGETRPQGTSAPGWTIH